MLKNHNMFLVSVVMLFDPKVARSMISCFWTLFLIGCLDPKVGRSMGKLQALETEVKQKYGCRVLIIQVLFSSLNLIDAVLLSPRLTSQMSRFYL